MRMGCEALSFRWNTWETVNLLITWKTQSSRADVHPQMWCCYVSCMQLCFEWCTRLCNNKCTNLKQSFSPRYAIVRHVCMALLAYAMEWIANSSFASGYDCVYNCIIMLLSRILKACASNRKAPFVRSVYFLTQEFQQACRMPASFCNLRNKRSEFV